MKTILIAVLSLLLGSCQLNDADKTKDPPPSPEKKLEYWHYGELPPDGYFRAMVQVYGMYGTTVVMKEGCEVTEEQVQAINRHNLSLEQALAQQYPGINRDSINKMIDKYGVIYDDVFTALSADRNYKVFLKEAADSGLTADFSIKLDKSARPASAQDVETVSVFLAKQGAVLAAEQLVYSFDTKTRKLTLIPSK